MTLLTAVEQKVGAGLLPVYRPMEPVIVGGRGSFLITEDGRELLDFTSGIGVNAFGYADAELNRVISNALNSGLIHTSNLFKTQPARLLADRLVELSCADRVFFSNSGGEANEGALKFARRLARTKGGA
jgi:acetylornithine/N-succinyldiaminopimelate aminotransferase